MARKASRREDSEYVGLLKSIFDFLLASGADMRAIRAIVDRAIVETVGRNKRTHQYGDSDLAMASCVLDSWHRDRRYIDTTAQPKPIPLYGRGPSVEALVRMENSHCDTAAFARRLKTLGFLARSGRNCYKPAGRVAVVAGLNPLIQQYVARSSVTLLRTIRQNATKPMQTPRLIERFAEVPDLPARYAADFRRFSHEQGWAMLKTLNDWLESRRMRRAKSANQRTIRAGVHLYAYVDSPRPKRVS